MKLVDNRYKISKIVEESIYNSVYEVIDFWNDDRRLFMKMYNMDRQEKVINYLINNFIDIAHISHDNLLSSEQFSIIKTIDRKKINIKRYYSTTEYIDSPTLAEVHEGLGLEEKLKIILKLCNLLDFLHYRGIVYKHLSPSNIFVLDNGDIKVMDLINIFENVVNRSYSDLTRYFLAPEVLLEQEEIVSYNSDKYSLGMLILYLLTEDFYSVGSSYQFKDIHQMDRAQVDYLKHIIRELTKNNPVTREISLRDIIRDIKRLFNIEHEFDLIKERSFLNFKTRIIGRKEEVERVLKLDDNLIANKKDKRIVLVSGDTGVGKTRFLKEISHRLRMRGREVYFLEINESIKQGLKPATNILRQTLKDAPDHILDKYGREFVKVLPELKYLLNADPLYEIGGDKESLRLYNRITNYFKDLTKERPIYLIIDNIDHCSGEFLRLFKYIVENMDNTNLVMIASYNERQIPKGTLKEKIFNDLLNYEGVEAIKISNFNLAEIGEFIQCILGMNYKPLKFSAVILRESDGNPRYIEYVLKDLFAREELFINENGFWEIRTQKYTDIYFSTSRDETLKNQISLIDSQYMDIMKIVSAYNDSISKSILSKIIDEENKHLNGRLEELVKMGLLEEKVADWGYSYGINNIQLKRLIYYNMPVEERIAIHRKLAELLLRNYKDNYRPIMEELIHHLISSKQRDKALNLIIGEAKKEENIMSSHSLYLWEEAYEIVKDMDIEYSLEVLESLGNIYFLKGENDKALKVYQELLEKSEKIRNYRYIVLAKLGISEVYLKRNLTDEILTMAEEIKSLSEKNHYPLGIAKAEVIYNRAMLSLGKLEEMERSLEGLLSFTRENKIEEVLGDIYNLKGLVEYFKGNIEAAIEFYEESIKYFQATDQFTNSTKPINNIANVFIQNGKYEEAMEYYRKGLEIVEKYGMLNLKLVFLNNIGEVYCNLGNYNEAKKYIEEARNIAIEIKDTNIIFLTSINLGLIYLATGEYGHSYNCYSILKESYAQNPNVSFEIVGQYYNFLGEFYSTFGQWDKAIEYSNKAIDFSKDFNNIEYLMSKRRLILVKYFKTGEYDKKSMEKLLAELTTSRLIFQRRNSLLQFGLIALFEDDYEFLINIIDEDNELRKQLSLLPLEYLRMILLYSASRDKDRNRYLENLEKEMKKHNIINLDILLNTIIATNFAKEGKYYQAINYLLEALDLIYSIIKKVPLRSLQISFIKSHKTDDIKRILSEAIYNISNKRLNFVYIDDLKAEEPIDIYFDYNSIFDLIDDEHFIKITKLNYLYEDIKDVSSIEELIARLTNDYQFNLNLILKYLSKETLAQKGFILSYDEEKDDYIPIASLDDKDQWEPNENLLALSSRYDRGILLSSLGSNIIGLHKDFLPQNIRAIICVPIFVPLIQPETPSVERRKKVVGRSNRIEGYVYLETGRVFNRFDKERQNLVNSLAKILYINIDNYRLRVFSNVDKLTGIYTRKYYESEFNKILMEAKRKEESFAVLMLDLDGFKEINDTYGHRTGDEILSIIGRILKKSIRSTDLVARYGGEEFIIILRNVLEDEAKTIAEKIRQNIEDIRLPGIEKAVTISTGISMFPIHSQFKEELIEKADQALYCAKERGKNRVIMWDTNLADTLNRGDRLAGIISGNTNRDQRNILALLDVIKITNEDIDYEDKIFNFLGRVIEVLEAENCAFIEIEPSSKEILNSYGRRRQNLNWVETDFLNETIVKRIVNKGEGEFLIDWESISEENLNLKTPNWQSVIAIPLIFKYQIKGVVYATVPIKEKEFDYNNYNLAKTLCDIFSTLLGTVDYNKSK